MVSEPYYSQRARSVCVSLSERFFSYNVVLRMLRNKQITVVDYIGCVSGVQLVCERSTPPEADRRRPADVVGWSYTSVRQFRGR